METKLLLHGTNQLASYFDQNLESSFMQIAGFASTPGLSKNNTRFGGLHFLHITRWAPFAQLCPFEGGAGPGEESATCVLRRRKRDRLISG